MMHEYEYDYADDYAPDLSLLTDYRCERRRLDKKAKALQMQIQKLDAVLGASDFRHITSETFGVYMTQRGALINKLAEVASKSEGVCSQMRLMLGA